MIRAFVQKVRSYIEMIMFQESVFTLPFVYMAAFLARKANPGWATLGWITVGMLSARALAMTLNRYIDREIDARNPRTAGRALPAGALTQWQCLLFSGVSIFFCLVSAYNLTFLVWCIAPVALGLFVFYPYTKRFTWTCHFWLGLTMSFAPLGGWVAVTNELSLDVLPLMAALACMISGSDIIYTFQDVDVDRRQGLYSVPAVFGQRRAMVIVKVLHTVCFASLFIEGVLLGLNNVYYAGVILAAGFTAYQTHTISSSQSFKPKLIFSSINAFISTAVFAFTISSLFLLQ